MIREWIMISIAGVALGSVGCEPSPRIHEQQGAVTAADVGGVAAPATGVSRSTRDVKAGGCSTSAELDGNRCLLPNGDLGICIAARGGCVRSVCGDGFVAKLSGEECDVASVQTTTCPYGEMSCMVCSAKCKKVAGATSYCGDGVVSEKDGEECDDGNANFGDGCTAACEVQVGWSCATGQPSHCTFGRLVAITAGGRSFVMGTREDDPTRFLDEMAHVVGFSRDFSISPTEVTQGEFEAIMGWNPSYFARGPGYPTEEVSWYDAVAYTNRLTITQGGKPCYSLSDIECVDATRVGADYMACMTLQRHGIKAATVELNGVGSVYDCTGFRLPTEAEWEYAARADTTTSTYKGDLDRAHQFCEEGTSVLEPIAWFCANAGDSTHSAGQRRENAWSLHDMLGNVNEWCHDLYGGYASGAQMDPIGAATGSYRACRGGSWFQHAREARAPYRYFLRPGYRSRTVGFRIARSRL